MRESEHNNHPTSKKYRGSSGNDMPAHQAFLIAGAALLVASFGGQWHIESIALLIMAVGAALWVMAKTRTAKPYKPTARVVHSHPEAATSKRNGHVVSSEERQ